MGYGNMGAFITLTKDYEAVVSTHIEPVATVCLELDQVLYESV